VLCILVTVVEVVSLGCNLDTSNLSLTGSGFGGGGG